MAKEETATRAAYNKLMEDRPEKFNDAEVDYRPSDTEAKCGNCLHFYKRTDGFTVCEIFRPDDDGPVRRDYVCRFFTTDRDEFPLL